MAAKVLAVTVAEAESNEKLLVAGAAKLAAAKAAEAESAAAAAHTAIARARHEAAKHQAAANPQQALTDTSNGEQYMIQCGILDETTTEVPPDDEPCAGSRSTRAQRT